MSIFVASDIAKFVRGRCWFRSWFRGWLGGRHGASALYLVDAQLVVPPTDITLFTVLTFVVTKRWAAPIIVVIVTTEAVPPVCQSSIFEASVPAVFNTEINVTPF